MVAYEQLLDRDINWAFLEGSMHFERESSVHKALRKITKKLDEIGVPYALAGGMALFFHGYRRFTEDVDILVTRAGLKVIHERLEGLGYLPPFKGSKNLRDTESGVRIEFLVTGDYPGDGKPKELAFPDPTIAATRIADMSILALPRLIELKLASGMTNPLRLQDIADVQKLIHELKLPEDLVDRLNPYVQDKYRELWRINQQHQTSLLNYLPGSDSM